MKIKQFALAMIFLSILRVPVSLADSIVGTWNLVSREDRSPDGKMVPELNLGSDALGNLMYDAQGNMSLQLMKRNRTKEGGFDAYFGTYVIDAPKGTVTHHVIGGSSAEDVGADMIRHFEVAGSELKLWFDTESQNGAKVTRTLIWKRAGNPPASLPKAAVARVWHGRTPESKSQEYTAYLYDAGIQKIRSISGNLGAQVFRRTENGVTDFVVISYWDSRETIKRFAGEDIEKTHHLPRDPEFLLELEPTVKHYDIITNEY